MFDGCKLLKEIKGIYNFNTSNILNMKGLFEGCNELEYLDLSSFNISNITDMGWIFCQSIN